MRSECGSCQVQGSEASAVPLVIHWVHILDRQGCETMTST